MASSIIGLIIFFWLVGGVIYGLYLLTRAASRSLRTRRSVPASEKARVPMPPETPPKSRDLNAVAAADRPIAIRAEHVAVPTHARRLPWWVHVVLAASAVLVLALAVAVAVLAQQRSDLTRKDDALRTKNAELVTENDRFVAINDAAKERAAKAEATARTALAKAKARANGILARSRTKLDARAARLNDRAANLDAREARLDERAAALSEQEEVVASSTFGDGVYLVGTDIPPGSYIAPGGEGCYWARKDSGGDIIDNYFATGGQVRATINSGETFETNGCGTWSPG